MPARRTTGVSSSGARASRATRTHDDEKTDPLTPYRQKRDFSRTPEPAPEPVAAARAKPAEGTPLRGQLVVQKHDATRLHYDVRIEINGAMMSWAVPKGPSYDPNVKRLAVETEDHPISYNSFEGRIPEGEYGAGDVLVWDRGTYETVPPGKAEWMREKGHFHLRFFGEKLQGEWHVVRTNRDGAKNQWLMFKANDDLADPKRDIIAERPESVLSGKKATRGPRRVGASTAGKTPQALLAAVGEVELATMATLATSMPGPPDGWLFEIKYDGYRLLAAKAGEAVRLSTRRANDWTERFRVVADAVAALPAREAVVDGEACALDERGVPSFQRLQAWLAGEGRGVRLVFAVFDLLWLDGRDLRALPIEERRELLEALLKAAGGRVLTLSAAVEGTPRELLRAARAQGLEGLIAKRKGSKYTAGRSREWLKLKITRRQELAIAGYLPLTGTDNEVGALLLAVRERGGPLRFAGRVGTGFSDKQRRELAIALDEARVDAPPIADAPRLKGAHWSKPRLVAEVGLAEWTADGKARHPTFHGLRADKSPEDCVREVPIRGDADGDGREDGEARMKTTSDIPPAARASGSSGGAQVPLTNPTKVLFPRDGITKTDIAEYYRAIAPAMLPHVAGRPLSLQRWPHGIDGEAWYQQRAPEKRPDFVRTIAVRDDDDHRARGERGERVHVVADNVETLLWLANLAALTLHQWSSHAPPDARTAEDMRRALDRPDYVVIDLDPGDGTWDDLIEVATTTRHLLDRLELVSYVKTSGKRGLHVLVPLAPGPTHEEATAFGEKVAAAVAGGLPRIATVERMKNKRRGRLYVDALQNGRGKTIVAPYTVRALDGAPVSAPVSWDEVTKKLDPSKLTIRTVLRRVEKHGDLLAGVLSAPPRTPLW